MALYKLPKLSYSYDALEPFIDEKTMRIHHTKHHQAYVNKLNQALEGYTDLGNKPIEALLADLNKIPQKIKKKVINNGGGHANHSLFWKILKKETTVKGKEITQAINNTFGGFIEFKKEFSQKALTIFGSGWAWVVVAEKKLKIVQTLNQDTPISQGETPILNLDVWEHAYYLKYQNRRADYIEAFFNIINWDEVNRLYRQANPLKS